MPCDVHIQPEGTMGHALILGRARDKAPGSTLGHWVGVITSDSTAGRPDSTHPHPARADSRRLTPGRCPWGTLLRGAAVLPGTPAPPGNQSSPETPPPRNPSPPSTPRRPPRGIRAHGG